MKCSLVKCTFGLTALVLLVACHRTPPDSLAQLPATVLWAWERPEDLRALNPRTAAVAFLAATITLSRGQAMEHPRLQPLRFAPGTQLLPVVRLESDSTGLPPTDAVVKAIRATLAQYPQAPAYQIDFDARRSERAWYTALLTELPKTPALTITALTSWCEQDGWIRNLPVTAAVPMLFRMGPSAPPPATLDFAVALCGANLGLATDELPSRIPHPRRLWYFSPRPWTSATASAIVGEAERRR